MSARARAVSVLPTPLGPTSRKTPIGRRGSVRLARAVRMRWAIASRACDWPMTRSSSFAFRFRTVLISSASILPTGMPVQPATTSAIVWASTQTCTSGDSPWSCPQLGRLGVELGSQRRELGARLGRRCPWPSAFGAACVLLDLVAAGRGSARRASAPRSQRVSSAASRASALRQFARPARRAARRAGRRWRSRARGCRSRP